MTKAHNRFTTNAGRGRAVPPTSVKLSPEELAKVDALAAAHGLRRSEWIRQRATTVGAARKPAGDAS